MKKDFYSAFEDVFRGERSLIKERLSFYIPFVKPISEYYKYSEAFALDLGCGRGEWLELLRDHGIKAKGVDLDSGMLKAPQDMNLDICLAEALNYLKSCEDNSLICLSAFHFIEHVTFQMVQSLVEEALRVLVPGGVLILETPNPENLVVSSLSFYMDPTHVRKFPPELLEFVVKYAGFDRVKLVRLNEDSKDIGEAVTLSDVFFGVSPDLGVIAQKEGSQCISTLVNWPSNEKVGIKLNEILAKYDERVAILESIVDGGRVTDLEEETSSVYASKSWKVTLPLRVLNNGWVSSVVNFIVKKLRLKQ